MRSATASFCTCHTSNPSVKTPPLQGGFGQGNWGPWSDGRPKLSKACKADEATSDVALSDAGARSDALRHADVGELGVS